MIKSGNNELVRRKSLMDTSAPSSTGVVTTATKKKTTTAKAETATATKATRNPPNAN